MLSLYLSNGPDCYPAGIDGIMLIGGRDRPHDGAPQEEERSTSAENEALLRRYVEEPLIGGSITGLSRSAREAGDAVGDVQTGYLRSYALVIAGAVAILVVVFVAVQ